MSIGLHVETCEVDTLVGVGAGVQWVQVTS